MSFNTVFALGAVYLAAIYLITLFVEKTAFLQKFTNHWLIYVFSLGVYISGWGVYNIFDFADQYGFTFLAFHIGMASCFISAPLLFAPLLRLTHAYKLSSLADLFAFRYHSPAVGALTTIIMLIGVIPFLSQQIQIVAETLQTLTNSLSFNEIALIFCVLITIFTLLFEGGPLQDPHNSKLAIAIAVNSLITLITFSLIGSFCLYYVFNGFSGLEYWLLTHPDVLTKMYSPVVSGPWHTLVLTFFVAVVTMPHMFHMAFKENRDPNHLFPASWAFPLYLLIMGLVTPIIFWAGKELGIPGASRNYINLIGQYIHQPLISLISLLCILSAVSSCIIVLTLALAKMCHHHFVLPWLVFIPSFRNFLMANNTNTYERILRSRRVLASLIIFASYCFLIGLNDKNDLSALGVMAFVTTLQCIPAIVGVLIWPIAHKKGVLTGLIVSLCIWLLLQIIPYTVGPLHITWSLPFGNPSLRIEKGNWILSAWLPLWVNIALFILISLLFKRSPEEVRAAQACFFEGSNYSARGKPYGDTIDSLIKQLSLAVGAKVAQHEVTTALNELKLNKNESRPFALRRLRNQLEANLMALMGPTVAQQITNKFLNRDDKQSFSEDIYFLENKLENQLDKLTGVAAELNTLRQFHRQILYNLPVGVCNLGADFEILGWNKSMETLTGVPSQQIVGSSLKNLPEPWHSLLFNFNVSSDNHFHKQEISCQGKRRWFNLYKTILTKEDVGITEGYSIVIEEITETQLLEAQLNHSERLASIGRLAAGVAHEIGNPVTGIACLAQNLSSDSHENETKEAAHQIIDQTKRISRILQSLNRFSRSGIAGGPPMESVSIYACVAEAIQLLSLDHRAKQLHYSNEIDPTITVLGDPQRLIQVFVNLLSNAHDASQPGNAVHLTSTVSKNTAAIQIIDEGEGVPSYLIKKVFDPFFTTKDPGKGTGLGLALVHRIIEDHGGQIDIHSPIKNGRGTKITISLPVMSSAANARV